MLRVTEAAPRDEENLALLGQAVAEGVDVDLREEPREEADAALRESPAQLLPVPLEPFSHDGQIGTRLLHARADECFRMDDRRGRDGLDQR